MTGLETACAPCLARSDPSTVFESSKGSVSDRRKRLSMDLVGELFGGAAKWVADLELDGFAADGEYVQLGGMIAAERGDLDSARRIWEALFEESPEIERLGYDLAQLYIAQNEEVSKVLGVIDTALEHPHDRDRLLAMRAEVERALAEASRGA